MYVACHIDHPPQIWQKRLMWRFFFLIMFFAAFACFSRPLRAQGTAPDAAAIVCTPEKEAAKQPEAPNYVIEDLYKKLRENMASLDTNCDGIIEEKEWILATNTWFQSLDSNHDDVLDQNEQNAYLRALGFDPQKRGSFQSMERGRNMKIEFLRMDTNKDGVVSGQEFVDFYYKSFLQMDKNSDGNLDITELPENFEGLK